MERGASFLVGEESFISNFIIYWKITYNYTKENLLEGHVYQ